VLGWYQPEVIAGEKDGVFKAPPYTKSRPNAATGPSPLPLELRTHFVRRRDTRDGAHITILVSQITDDVLKEIVSLSRRQ
jgi:hypothetical protein